MRRKDREITDLARVDEIIGSCDCFRLGLTDGKSVYIVPLNFAYTRLNGTATFYLHCAREGKKLDLIAANPNVGVELDTNHAVHAGEKGCDYAFRFQSVIGSGVATLLDEPAEKKEALRRIVWHYSGREDWAFTDAEAASVTVVKVTVTEMACKEHL